nr:hypothetical protein CFP56_68774 [Quercus suber]
MARTPRSKPDVETTAAYAVSQPLFDALRAATASIDEQKTHLTTARDLIQQVHIQTPHANGPQDIEKYELFLQSATQAWQCATEVFSNIFETLANVTGPDAATGREPSQEFEVFRTMAKTATDAKNAVAGYVEKRAEGPVKVNLEGEAENVEPHAGRPKQDRENGMPKSRKRAPSAAESMPLQHRPPKMLKVAKIASQDNLLRSAIKGARETTDVKALPKLDVEFEDVSTEVAARLKAKEEKKKAKKDAKKRKRESNDSFVEPTIPSHDTDNKPDKPRRKRAKAEEVVPSIKPAIEEVKPKRKKSEAAVTSQRLLRVVAPSDNHSCPIASVMVHPDAYCCQMKGECKRHPSILETRIVHSSASHAMQWCRRGEKTKHDYPNNGAIVLCSTLMTEVGTGLASIAGLEQHVRRE